MLNKIMAWLREECPFCKKRFIHHTNEHFPTRGCPDGHYKVETHPSLEVQIHHHGKN